jgi:hypothetical protein
VGARSIPQVCLFAQVALERSIQPSLQISAETGKEEVIETGTRDFLEQGLPKSGTAQFGPPVTFRTCRAALIR